MPGQAGTATAPGQSRIAAVTSPLPTNGVGDDNGAFVSEELRMIGLSGLSINVDRLGLNPALAAIDIVVQIRVDSDNGAWINLGIPCCCDPTTLTAIVAGPAGNAVFVSWDHIAAREARFVAVSAGGVPAEAMGRIILMGTST